MRPDEKRDNRTGKNEPGSAAPKDGRASEGTGKGQVPDAKRTDAAAATGKSTKTKREPGGEPREAAGGAAVKEPPARRPTTTRKQTPAAAPAAPPSTATPTSTPMPIDEKVTPPPRTDAPIALPALHPADRDRLVAGLHTQPHDVLGAHPAKIGGRAGVGIRAIMPHATEAEVVLGDGRTVALTREYEGLVNIFGVFLPGATMPVRYRLRFHFADGVVWERDDPYRFLPTIGEVDLHLFNEGTHRKLWEKLGAHVRTMDGVEGVSFAVWAPNARRASVIGDFNGWDGRIFPMRALGSSGVYELFVPDIAPGALYKYELVTPEGMIRVKTDPYAFKLEQSPGTASIVQAENTYTWKDGDWMTRRAAKDHYAVLREPMLIYEVHLGSWARVPEEGNRAFRYGEIAQRLAQHVKSLGFTHIELLPVMEHPFYGSWGYQVSGYYAPTSRYGTPDDFRYFVDTMHEHGIGVILDWVPAHFPKDDHALRRYDGTALYEHADPRLGEHPDWGTLIFNYGRNEVRNFLIANALYWLDEYHVDGLRVDAVASMLYLDYSRKSGEWLRNRYGGRENLDAIDFLKQFNETIRIEEPGCFTVAEESTAWPSVTKPANEGGLGFTFKWNMGWMHDTLTYFAKDPIYRTHHHDQLTFAMMYEYNEHFIMPLSHDEVVHLKGSLYQKMPGDHWQKLANLRLLLAYMVSRPGKKLLFMGTELATPREWNHDTSLDWHLLDEPQRAAYCQYVGRLGQVYQERPELWREDPSWEGFSWIDVADRANSVISFVRRDGDRHVVVVLNLTPVPRENYRLGVPAPGVYGKLLSSDDAQWGGSGYGAMDRFETEQSPFHGYEQSIALTLPPLGAVLLAPEA
jgi:1,4-alpha-glucan branching enzyme